MVEQSVPVSMGSEQYHSRDVAALRITRAVFPRQAFLEPHVHDRPIFSVVLEGGFDLAFTSPGIRRRNFRCLPGSIFTEPAGEKHSNEIAPNGAKVVVVQPDTVALDLPTRCTTFLDRINHFRDAPITTAAHRLAREVRLDDDLSPLAIEGLALQLLADAARLDEGAGRCQDTVPSWLNRAIQFLHDNARTVFRIEQVAAAAGVHPAHLASVFRQVHRMPIASYVRRLRIEWAADRLVHSDEPIVAIAAGAGFADQAHLTRWFKRVTGSTPAVYRRCRRSRTAGNAPGPG